MLCDCAVVSRPCRHMLCPPAAVTQRHLHSLQLVLHLSQFRWAAVAMQQSSLIAGVTRGQLQGLQLTLFKQAATGTTICNSSNVAVQSHFGLSHLMCIIEWS